MQKESLEQRKTAIQSRFDELSKQKTDIDDEMKRLQGEFRLVEDLLKEPTPQAPKPKRIRKVVEVDA